MPAVDHNLTLSSAKGHFRNPADENWNLKPQRNEIAQEHGEKNRKHPELKRRACGSLGMDEFKYGSRERRRRRV